MSTSLIDEIKKIANGEVTEPIETQPGATPMGAPPRPPALDPITAPKKKKKRRKKAPINEPEEIELQTPLERRPPTSPRPDQNQTIESKNLDTPETQQTSEVHEQTGYTNTAFKSDENNNQQEPEPMPQQTPQEDNRDHILGVYIHRTDHITFSMRRILIKVNIMSGMTNSLLTKEDQNNKSVSYYENTREIPIKHIMPIMSQPFQVDKQKSLLPQWEELLEFNENYNYITNMQNAAFFIFQVQDCVEARKTVAWAYLRVLNHVTNQTNLNKRLRLQLFAPPSKQSTSDDQELAQLVSLIGQSKRQKINSTLHVTISSLLPFSKRPIEHQTVRSMRPDQKEIGRAEIIAVEGVPSLPSPTGNFHSY